MDPSQLSAVLKCKKGISPERALSIASALGLSKAEAEEFLLSIRKDFSRNQRDRKEALLDLKKEGATAETMAQTLSMDVYKMVSDWHTSAILEYLRRPRANQSVEVLSQQFQISALLVTEALSRLERLEWIEKQGTRWKVKVGLYVSPSGIPSEAIRNHHTQVLKKAETALHFQSLEQRDFRSTELVIRMSQIPEIKSFLNDTWKEFCSRFASNETGDAVYEFSTQLFELGKIIAPKKQTRRES